MSHILIFCIAFGATLMSSMSGGGATMITVPAWIWMGLPLPAAIAIEKVSAMFWVLPAAYNYLKGRTIDWLFVVIFSTIGLVGAYFGVAAIMRVDERIMKVVIGCLIVALVIFVYVKKDLGLQPSSHASRTHQRLSYLFALPLGFYEGLFGAGNGIFFSIFAIYTRGIDFMHALGYYYAVAFAWAIFGAYLLIQGGYYDMSFSIPAILGSVCGSIVGSRYARSRGNKFIKLVFVIVGGLLGLKLIFWS